MSDMLKGGRRSLFDSPLAWHFYLQNEGSVDLGLAQDPFPLIRSGEQERRYVVSTSPTSNGPWFTFWDVTSITDDEEA